MRPKIIVKPPGPKSTEWLERNGKVLAGTNMVYTPGLITAHGEGCFVTDPDGNVFLDLCQSRATEGHSNRKIIEHVKEYMDKDGLTGGIYTTTKLGTKAVLSEMLLKMMPGKLQEIGKVAYCNSGTESCDYALSIARMETNRKLVFAFKGAYHGMTGSAMMASSWKAIKKKHFTPLISDTHIVPYAYCYRCAFKQEHPSCNFACLEYIKRLFDDTFSPDDVAGFIFEPMMGHAGFITPPPGYFEEMKKLSDEIGALLIDDEVYTGFGKSGKNFAIEHWDAEPDLVAIGKPLGAAGFNLAAVIGPGEMMDNSWLINSGAFSSGAPPLACAAAIKKIELLHEENWAENAEKVGNYFLKRLREMYDKYPLIGDVRGRGLLIGVEFVRNRETKEPAYKEAVEIRNMLFNRGVMASLGGTTANPTLKISTALVITEEIAEAGLEIFESVLKDYKG
jgi:4-aminobutyrate aminotransferase-like enzyme